jgi:hypothetical protein
MGAFNKLFGRLRLTSDVNVATQTTTVIQTDTTNSNLAIVPNGTGALIASIPDGTATGGNARGNNAVDLQMGRNNAANVASGNNATIGGGYSNKASGTVAPTVAGGQYNFATGLFVPTIGGGSDNIASSSYSTVSGGQSNIASTNTHATVVGGQGNTSSGQYSISGGTTNTASGSRSISLGDSNTASGYGAVCIGLLNNGTGQYSFSIGFRSASYLESQFSLASNIFSSNGDAQQSLLTARNSSALTTGATLALSLDGTGTSKLIIPNGNNRAWNVTIDTIAVVTAITGTATGVSVGDCYRETKQLLFKIIGGTSSIVGTVDTSAIKSDLGMATASITISAGGSQQMAITFTAPTFVGGGSVTCRVVSKVMLVEVAY